MKKSRLTEVGNLSLTEGPQTITRRKDSVVVISSEKSAELTGERQTSKNFLLSCPSLDGLELERDPSPIRDVEL